MKHFFCRNQTIYKLENELFMGEEIIEKYVSNYRKCKVCGKVEEFNYDYSSGGYWSRLSEVKTNILNKHLVKYNDILILKDPDE